MVEEPTRGLYGYILIALASVLFGTLGIFAKLAFEYGITPQTLIAVRLLVSFFTLLVALLAVKRSALRVRKSDLFSLLVLGVFAIAFQRVCYFYAVNLTTATVAAVLFFTYPAFVTLSAWLFLKERITLGEVLAIVLAFSGVVLVVRLYDFSSFTVNLAGVIFGLLSSLLFVLYFMMVKGLRNRYAGWTLTVYGEGIGVATLMPVIVLSFPDVAGFPLNLWLLILVIAWISSLLAYLLYSHALKYVKASKGSILAVLEPLSTALLSTMFIGERLEYLQMVGIALALVGVSLLFWHGKAGK